MNPIGALKPPPIRLANLADASVIPAMPVETRKAPPARAPFGPNPRLLRQRRARSRNGAARVLDRNEPSIRFCKTMVARRVEQWRISRLGNDALPQLGQPA
jgi:hypothetical protein